MLELLSARRTADVPGTDPQFPLILSAGERRSFSANTIIRDPSWRKRDANGALRVSPADAERFDLHHGGQALVTTSRGSVQVAVEVNDTMLAGHISLPNGLGLDYRSPDGVVTAGVAPNELTDSFHRDPIAGTPFHKHVPARVEPVRVDAPISVGT
jgi:formate dehydrogenase